MNGRGAQAVLRALGAAVSARESVEPAELVSLLSSALGLGVSPELSSKRSAAGRLGGRRSAEARAEANGSAQPKQTRSKPEALASTSFEANPKQTPKQNPLPSSPPSPPSDSYPSGSKALVVVAKEPVTPVAREPEATAAPTNLAEALTEALVPRAQRVAGDPTLASLLRVREWPEVNEVALAWHRAHGLPGEPRVTDSAALAVAKLFAFPFFKSDVLKVAAYLPTTEKYRGKVHLAAVTPDVASIALSELDKSTASRDAVRERLRSAGGGPSRPSPIGDILPRAGGGG